MIEWLKKNFWGLITIAGVTIVCLMVVKVFKKPGQLNVIEAQGMDMASMAPPPGAIPVGVVSVKRKLIEESVTYTGSVQAYEDEDVYPRVTGRIMLMPAYPGNFVQKGDLLVQLDPKDESEYKAKLDQARNEADAEMHNASIAKEEFKQKEFELKAAQEAETAAQKEVEQARANLSYWIPEEKRQKSLLDKEVVSLSEYQLDASQRDTAKAQTEAAEAKLREARNLKLAAQAQLNAMVHHVGHQYLQAKKAKAAELNAALYDKYTRISAKDDGVVTKRLISPGVVVTPGMLILKVAHIDKARIQAEVSSQDSEKIKLGDVVYIKGSRGSQKELKAEVTSIFPAADQISRTFTIEALVDNIKNVPSAGSSTLVSSINHFNFLPGQYVVMRIVTGKEYGLAIPTSAIVWSEGIPQVWKVADAGDNSGHKTYTCLMHPDVVSDKPGKCPKCGMELQIRKSGSRRLAILVKLKTGLSNPDFTEVVTGLQEGDDVVSAGYENLWPGAPVVETNWTANGPTNLPNASELAGAQLNASNNWLLQQTTLDLKVTASLLPVPPKSGANTFVLKIEKANHPLSGATITGKTSMPGMNMSGPQLHGLTNANGEIRIKSDFTSGLWQLQISITTLGQAPVDTTIDLEVP